MIAKKIISILCAGVIAFSATACGGDGAGGNGTANLSETVNGALAGEIKVSCYDTMVYKDFLETQARAFMDTHPGTAINIEAVGAMPEIRRSESGNMSMATIEQQDDSQARLDYINRMSTELMGGRGADLLAMDILPWTKFADGGQLDDLSQYFEADPNFNKGDYRNNIWDALKYKGGQYLLALDYDFNYMAYDSTLFNEEEQQVLDNTQAPSYEWLIDFAKPAYEREAAANQENASKMLGYSAQDLFENMFRENYYDFLDIENKKANFNDGNFAALLNTVMGYGDKGYLRSSVSEGGPQALMAGGSVGSRYFYKSNTQYGMLLNAVSGPNRRMRVSTGGDSGVTDDDKVIGPVVSKDGKASFTYSQAYGLNANSQNKALAWAFLKYLLSDEVQSGTQLSRTGLPVNNAARARKADQAASGELFAAGRAGGGMNPGGSGGNMGMRPPGEGGAPEGALYPPGEGVTPGGMGPGGGSGENQGRRQQRDGGAPGGMGNPDGGAQTGGQGGSGGNPQTTGEQSSPNGNSQTTGGQGSSGADSQTTGGQSSPGGNSQTTGGQDPGGNAPPQPMSAELTAEQMQKLEKYMVDIERFSDMLNYYPVQDETINNIIKDETGNFVSGSKSAEEAATAIQSKVELYLNE